MSTNLLIRGTTGHCRKCYQWHKLYFVSLKDDKKKLLMFCRSQKLFLPYQEIDGIEEYLLNPKEEYVFIKDGFKIIKKSEFENPKLDL